MNALQQYLASLDACSEAVAWAEDHTTLTEAWAVCPRSDWMIWLLCEANYADDRICRLYEAVERFAIGEATREELDEAAAAARGAAWGEAGAAAWGEAWGEAGAAAWAAAWGEAGAAARAQQADILREMIPAAFIAAIQARINATEVTT